MSQIEHKSLAFTLKTASEDGGEFEGLASAFYCIDDSYWNDIIAPGAFKADLPEFLESGFVGGCNHDWDQPIGRPTFAEETPEGLSVKASISETTHGKDMRVLMKDGVIKRMSIGFRTLAREYLQTAEEVMSWWVRHGYTPSSEDVAKSQYGARVLTRIKLYEFSPVAVPANQRAVITGVKSGDEARAPLAFRDHSSAVLATCEEYLERVQSLRELRRAEGRGLSPDHTIAFRRLHDALGTLLVPTGTDAEPEAKTETPATPATPEPTDSSDELRAQAAAAFAQYQSLLARQHGVAL